MRKFYNYFKKMEKINANPFKWDKWQQKVIDYKGSITIRAGRQVGKSTTVGKRRAKLMLEYPCSTSLIIAPAQRQSSQLFIKVMSWLEKKNQEVLKEAGGYKADTSKTTKANMEGKRQYEYDHGIFNEIPTKTTIFLKKDFKKQRGTDNEGSICYSLPAGKTGIYLRTFSLDFLDIDEAAYVPEAVYTALKPMLAVAEKARGLGWETFLSTPYGKGGFFFNSHQSKHYRHFHISSEDCPRISRKFLAKERKRMSKREYRQEWLGEFTDDMSQFFPSSLIKDRTTILGWSYKTDYNKGMRYYLGVDFAGYGGDENAFVICEMIGEKLRIISCLTTERVSSVDTIGRIVALDADYHFKKIFVDDGGLGSPITDILKERLGRKILGLNNAKKRIRVYQNINKNTHTRGQRLKQEDNEVMKGIFKEDLYSNTLVLMEQGKIDMILDMDLVRSMKSITFSYGDIGTEKKISIFGNYAHLTEALVRACWCKKERGLKLFSY